MKILQSGTKYRNINLYRSEFSFVEACGRVTLGRFRGTKGATKGEIEVLGYVVDVVPVKFVPLIILGRLYLCYPLQQSEVGIQI